MDGVVVEKSRAVDAGADAELHTMPGILPRPEGTPKALVGTKMTTDIQHGASINGGPCESTGPANGPEHRLANGHHEYTNGIHPNGIATDPADVQRKTPNAIETLMDQLPPEIEHITFGYVPFHLLMSRLVQETFVGLTEVINEMSETPVPQSLQHTPPNHLNHLTNGNADISGGNVQKKLRMLNYTSDRRAKFIKILVLLRWAQQAEAVSRIIDLNVWTQARLFEYRECVSWTGELKRMMLPLRDPNPDIRTALEVLSLGKASWLPDLGYLPPEPLSSLKLLKTLRKINTLLSIRLNLHETIPPSLREFSVASGRATFRVPEEFEVDLSIAEEDPSSQLYFIDFRFIFSPTPTEVPNGRLRDEIEGRANDVLGREGLDGLFDFLHNLTLTHKLSILRSQAHELARGYWSEQLKVETVHRSVVIQYWSNRSGGKNWIEIGLKRGQEPKTSYGLSGQRIPFIDLRWFRGGKEVTNATITMRLNHLSVGTILRQVIALHTSFTLEQMAATLRNSPLYLLGSLRLKHHSSSTEPLEACLLVQLTTAKAIKVVQEPVSGRFSILPASKLNSQTEYKLNQVVNPATDGASQLHHLRSLLSQEEADTGARTIGWEPILSLNPNSETMQKLFGAGIQHRKFFRRPNWGSNWILAFTTSPDGDTWWVIELTNAETTSNTRTMSSAIGAAQLQAAYKIRPPGTNVIEPSQEALADIDNLAAGMICQFVDTRALLSQECQHKVQMSRQEGARTRPGSLLIRNPTNFALAVMHSSSKTSLPWLEELIRLDYHGLDPTRQFAIHVASVHMQRSITGIQHLLAKVPLTAFVSATQTLPEGIKLQFLTRVGDTVISSLRSRLKAIGLLLDFASTLKSHNLSCSAASLTHLVFKYTSSSSPLTATVHFPEDAPRYITLSKRNPHLRIIDHLTEQLRSRGLSPVIGILRMTLPLLQTFGIIEAGQENAGVHILTRSDQWYQIRYSEKFPKSGFDVRLRLRRDDAMWFIPESSIKKPEGASEAFEQGLKDMTRGKGDGWWGVNGGIIAPVTRVENLIVKLNELFLTNKHIAGESNVRKRKAEDEVVEID